jgi:hypothetical protein
MALVEAAYRSTQEGRAVQLAGIWLLAIFA